MSHDKSGSKRNAENLLSFDRLTALVRAAHRPKDVQPRIVGIDGCGGSGKSTLATRLAEHFGDAVTIHTDHFATWDNPLDWYRRLITDALQPLSAGQLARFQVSDWEKRAPGSWITVAPAPVVVLEGVSATRKAFAPFLAYRIWVDADRSVRLARGVERDGEAMRGQWDEWMRDEDAYVAREHPEQSADLRVAGDPHIHHDPEREVVVRRGRAS